MTFRIQRGTALHYERFSICLLITAATLLLFSIFVALQDLPFYNYPFSNALSYDYGELSLA